MMSPNQEGRGAYQPLTTADRVDAGDADLEHRLYASETSPTFSQASTLRRTPASIPWTTYAIALVELAERASFYGLISIAPNFIQRPLPEGGPGTGAPPRGSETTPGALGLGLQTATAMFTLFTMLGYTSPLIGGALADMRWGKYKTIMIGVVITIIAHIVSVYAALPSLLQSGKALIPFVAAMVLLCSCSGLIKANVAPVMAEQYTPIGDFTKIMPDGETVIVDREMTIQRIMSAYFASVNVGAFFAIASAFAEKYVGFWLAFLIPGIICLIMPFVLIIARPSLVPSPPPSSSALVDAVRGIKSSGDGLPELIDIEDEGEAGMRIKAEVKGKGSSMIWFFFFFAVYNVADGGINSLITSLAGSMTTQGVPNDFIITANPLAIVLGIPILNRFVYPFIEARGITFGPVKRVVTGFLIAAAAMTWCGVLQYRVYATSPCGWSATNCTEGSGVSPLSAWLVLPTPIMLGISEAIAVVSAMELGYIMSPPGLRSIVNALFLFTQSIAAVLVLFLIPLMRDPLLLLVFGIVTMSVLAAAAGVWRMYGHLDHAM